MKNNPSFFNTSPSSKTCQSLWTWRDALYISFLVIGFEIFFSANYNDIISAFFYNTMGVEARIFSLYYILAVRILDLLFILLYIFFIKKKGIYVFGLSGGDIKKHMIFSISICLAFASFVITVQLISLLFFSTDLLKTVFVSGGSSAFQHTGYLLSYILIVVICAPFVEEVFFRGIIYTAMRAYLKKNVSILLNGLLFACMHGLFTPFFFIQLTGGIIFALLYEKTGSIIPSYIVHSSGNLAIIGIIFYYT